MSKQVSSYEVGGGIFMRGNKSMFDIQCTKVSLPHGEFAMVDPFVQIVIPQSLRQLVLQTAHDTSGHMGVKKTYKLLLKRFFWTKFKHDVSKYIKSCHKCQLTGKPNQSLKPAPLSPIPVISQPFEHLIVDCVGPLPQSKAGKARQGKFIYIAHFIHSGNSKCVT